MWDEYPTFGALPMFADAPKVSKQNWAAGIEPKMGEGVAKLRLLAEGLLRASELLTDETQASQTG